MGGKRLSRREIMMIAVIVMLLIAIATRWEYIRKTVAEAVGNRIERIKER